MTSMYIIKTTYDLHVPNENIQNRENLKAFLLESAMKQGYPLTDVVPYRMWILSYSHNTEEGAKADTEGGRSEISLVGENMTVYFKKTPPEKWVTTDDQFYQRIKMYSWERHQNNHIHNTLKTNKRIADMLERWLRDQEHTLFSQSPESTACGS